MYLPLEDFFDNVKPLILNTMRDQQLQSASGFGVSKKDTAETIAACALSTNIQMTLYVFFQQRGQLTAPIVRTGSIPETRRLSCLSDTTRACVLKFPDSLAKKKRLAVTGALQE